MIFMESSETAPDECNRPFEAVMSLEKIMSSVNHCY
jgi:hypothetical protein